jgi:hypothetical protein
MFYSENIVSRVVIMLMNTIKPEKLSRGITIGYNFFILGVSMNKDKIILR